MFRESQYYLFSAEPHTVSHSRADCFSQKYLLQKLNQYLKSIGETLLDETGCCHGLSLLWLKRMAKSRENEFYNFIRMIIESPIHDLKSYHNEIKKFVKSVDKRQNPLNYYNHTFTYRDINVLLKLNSQEVLDQTCLSKDLSNIFEQSRQEGVMFCISNGKDYLCDGEIGKHSIAIYVRNNHFYLYDANYKSGLPVVFDDASQLVREMRVCLYSRFNLRPPPYMPLEIRLLHASDTLYEASMMDALVALWQSVSTRVATINSYLPVLSLFSSATQNDEMDLEAGSREPGYDSTQYNRNFR